MTKIVNCWNEWDPLKRVIIGRPEGTNVPAPEPAWWYDLPRGGFPLGSWGPFPQEMVDAANEQMSYFVAQLEKRGVLVERIDIQPFMMNKPLPSPLGWVQLNAHGVNNVRDVTTIHGNYIVEATTVGARASTSATTCGRSSSGTSRRTRRSSTSPLRCRC